MLPLNKYTVVGAGVALLVAVYLGKKTVDAVPKALNAINPLNNDNIINQGATSLYQGLTGSNGSIGGDIYDATHGGALDATSSNNFIYQGVSSLVGGDLGTKIYDWFH